MHRHKTLQVFGLFLASGILTGMMTLPEAASAAARRTGGHACVGVSTYTAYASDYYGIFSNSYSYNAQVHCPIESDTELEHDDMTFVKVHGYDGHSSSNVTAKACVTYWDGSGGACGTSDSSSGTGNYTIQLSTAGELSPWSDVTDFPFVHVSIPRISGSTKSYVYGFYMGDW